MRNRGVAANPKGCSPPPQARNNRGLETEPRGSDSQPVISTLNEMEELRRQQVLRKYVVDDIVVYCDVVSRKLEMESEFSLDRSRRDEMCA
jgi:hypothetical protein